MKKFFALLLACALLAGIACAKPVTYDLQKMTRQELEALSKDIDKELKENHTAQSKLNDKVRAAVTREVESYFKKKGIDISWAWVDYSYSHEWNFYTLSTHIDYKDEKGKKQKPDVYAETYWTGSDYAVYYLKVGNEVLIDRRSELPAKHYLALGETEAPAATAAPEAQTKTAAAATAAPAAPAPAPQQVAVSSLTLDGAEKYSLEELEAIHAAMLEVLNQKRIANAKIEFAQPELTLGKGKSQKVAYTVSGRTVLPAKDSVVWTMADPAVATVDKAGTVVAKTSGTTELTCTITFAEDGAVLTASLPVSVITAVASVTAAQQKVSVNLGEELDANAFMKVLPADATNPALTWTIDRTEDVTFSADGKLTADAPGTYKLTAQTTDGTAKTASLTVFVPSIAVPAKEISVTEKTGDTIYADYYGENDSNITVTASGTAASVHGETKNGSIEITIVPVSAGSTTITINDKASPESKQMIKVTVEHSAVYDRIAYPAIKYKEAYRYPDQHKGEKVSFSGKVLQVMNGSRETTLRISSKGNWDDVVYVEIANSDLLVPILEDDKVTVYGTLDGNYTYSALFGNEITIPLVQAERINLQTKK